MPLFVPDQSDCSDWQAWTGGKRETGAKPVRSRHCEPESGTADAIAKVRRRGVHDDPKARKPAGCREHIG